MKGEDITYAALALMVQGNSAAAANDARTAAARFGAVANNANAPQALRDLATIRGVTARYDRLAPADVIGRLKPLAVPGNAWFGPAGELVAMAYLDQGNTAEAGALFAAIAKDKGTSETLRSRTRQMAGLLGVDAIDDVDTVLNRPQAAGE